jgi:hypothetical protein
VWCGCCVVACLPLVYKWLSPHKTVLLPFPLDFSASNTAGSRGRLPPTSCLLHACIVVLASLQVKSAHVAMSQNIGGAGASVYTHVFVKE